MQQKVMDTLPSALCEKTAITPLKTLSYSFKFVNPKTLGSDYGLLFRDNKKHIYSLG